VSYRLALFFGYRFVVKGGVSDGTRHWIKHGLEQTDDSRDLAWRQPFDQFMRLLLFAAGIVRHRQVSLLVAGPLTQKENTPTNFHLTTSGPIQIATFPP
jgi:hypothetical protein